LINREESYIYISELKVAAFSCQVWWCRSDHINFSMPYSQIADLTLTLCFVNSIICAYWKDYTFYVVLVLQSYTLIRFKIRPPTD